jgi:hypothetical protein
VRWFLDLPSDRESRKSADHKQEAEKVRQQRKTVIWFVSFVWLNKTNEMNKASQMS